MGVCVFQALDYPMPEAGAHKFRADDKQAEHKQAHSSASPSRISRAAGGRGGGQRRTWAVDWGAAGPGQVLQEQKQ